MRGLWMGALGLCLAVGLAAAGELKGTPAGGKPGAKVDLVDAKEPACGNHGTAIDFVETPADAAKQAKKEGKLVFVLHVSGNFEDPRFT